MPRLTPEELEKLIHQNLRALPDRAAPRSLESRVLAAIEARQSLPWWRQSFAHWPMAARGAFLVVTGILAALLIGLFFRSGVAVDGKAVVSGPLAVLAQLRTIVGGIGAAGSMVLRSIPSYWLYGGLAVIGVMYATLLGLGATAYRYFINHR